MKSKLFWVSAIVLMSFNLLSAKEILVSSLEEFKSVQENISPGEVIVWEDGTYKDVFLEVKVSDITIKAKTLGGTIFTGASRVRVMGDNITLEGFQFLDGEIPKSKHIIDNSGSYNHFTQLNFSRYICFRYLSIREESKNCTISHCNFENRLNLDDKNIVSILAEENSPGNHVVKYCSFKNFAGEGNDMGIEPLRLGVSFQQEFMSNTIVEYCYFTGCNGDDEIISNKSKGNIFRYNTFENNPISQLVLRHGDGAVVYGNFFLNGKGGIRVREGSNHAIFNNYFQGLTESSIYLQNSKHGQLKDIFVAHNTFIKTAKVKLDSKRGEYPPKKVLITNNLFVAPTKKVLIRPTGSEKFKNNFYTGNLGVDMTISGMTQKNPMLEENEFGYYQLTSKSPAIDSSYKAKPKLLKFNSLSLDYTVAFDVMKNDRPTDATRKDIGCWEYMLDVNVKPHATEENTGPTYL